MGIAIRSREVRIHDLVSKSAMCLFYGVAGAGKTNILLTLTRDLCREAGPCLYISTEETLHYEKVGKQAENYANTLFTEVYELDKLLELFLQLSYMDFRILVVDSINSLYRAVAYEESSLAKFTFSLGFLRSMSVQKGLKVLASAQVRAGEDDVEASGMSLLEYYFDTMFQVGFEKDKRFVKLVKPKYKVPLVNYFEINDKGAVWV
uniref:AAA family ATPase n=1 Tax=Thermosphaera aggregans TaxID=54254 RepID=A0A7C2BKU2_9CREN